MEPAVKHTFDSYPDHIKPKMEALRTLIYQVAENTDGVGQITETLKWSEPAYLTTKPKSGTTVRMDWKKRNPEKIGIYVSCNTTLVETYRGMFPEELEFEGNRAILIPVDEPIPEKALKICIQMAMTYHLKT